MLIIRLARIGRRNEAHFRVVVAEKQKAAQKKFIELLGDYHPMYKENQLKINTDRILYWISKGAQVSPTVEDMLYKQGIGNFEKRKFSKKKKVVAQAAPAPSSEEAPKAEAQPTEAEQK